MCDLKSHIGAEYQALRGELISLKDCQVRYFWSSVTATGVLVGLGSRLNTDHPSALLYLAPLLIVIPCWLIFFDKATTITRIVGYTRILEKIIILPNPSYSYVGWENALRKFRDEQPETKVPGLRRFFQYMASAVRAVPLILFLGPHHRYWSINWLTFFLLCVFCLVVAGRHSRTTTETGLLIVFSVVTALASVRNMALLEKLNTGEYSYNANEEVWKKLLA